MCLVASKPNQTKPSNAHKHIYLYISMPGVCSQKNVPFISFECFGERFIVCFVVLMWWWILLIAVVVAVIIAAVGLRDEECTKSSCQRRSRPKHDRIFFLRYYFICIPKCMYWMCFKAFFILHFVSFYLTLVWCFRCGSQHILRFISFDIL